MKTDVVVVGAGPAGLLAAYEAARYGTRVLVLEEHSQVGIPDHCAGLLSATGLSLLRLQPPNSIIQNQVKGAIIHAPAGHSIIVERGRHEAFVIDRTKFDQWLANRATDVGADVRTSTKANGLIITDRIEGVRVGRNNEAIKSAIVINGEGSRCIISRAAGLPTVPRRSMLPAYQFEVSNVNVHEDLVEMFYSNRIAPGFFAWIIPLGDRKARVGLAARDKSKIRLRAAIQHHPIMRERVGSGRIDRGFGGIVLVGLPVNKTSTAGLLTVGDSAGIVKATTGGGVIIGGSTAQIAGRIAGQAIYEHNVTSGRLGEYDKIWRTKYLRELRTMYLTQRIIGSLSDKGLNQLIKDAADLGLVDTVRKEGDMDMQGKVIMRLLRRPETLLSGLRVIRHMNLANL